MHIYKDRRLKTVDSPSTLVRFFECRKVDRSGMSAHSGVLSEPMGERSQVCCP
ncbi:hypothetical protein [Phormidesmis sp. 146-33]